jgi:hypothetical protein
MSRIVVAEQAEKERFSLNLYKNITSEGRTLCPVKLTNEQLLQLIYEAEIATEVIWHSTTIVLALDVARKFDGFWIYLSTTLMESVERIDESISGGPRA